jgi:hypothetical protein
MTVVTGSRNGGRKAGARRAMDSARAAVDRIALECARRLDSLNVNVMTLDLLRFS